MGSSGGTLPLSVQLRLRLPSGRVLRGAVSSAPTLREIMSVAKDNLTRNSSNLTSFCLVCPDGRKINSTVVTADEEDLPMNISRGDMFSVLAPPTYYNDLETPKRRSVRLGRIASFATLKQRVQHVQLFAGRSNVTLQIPINFTGAQLLNRVVSEEGLQSALLLGRRLDPVQTTYRLDCIILVPSTSLTLHI